MNFGTLEKNKFFKKRDHTQWVLGLGDGGTMVTELHCLFPSGSNYVVTFCSTLQILPNIFEISQKRSKHVSLSNIHHSLFLPFGDAVQQTGRIPCRGRLLSPCALFCSVLCPWTMPETLWLVTVEGRLPSNMKTHISAILPPRSERKAMYSPKVPQRSKYQHCDFGFSLQIFFSESSDGSL